MTNQFILLRLGNFVVKFSNFLRPATHNRKTRDLRCKSNKWFLHDPTLAVSWANFIACMIFADVKKLNYLFKMFK